MDYLIENYIDFGAKMQINTKIAMHTNIKKTKDINQFKSNKTSSLDFIIRMALRRYQELNSFHNDVYYCILK